MKRTCLTYIALITLLVPFALFSTSASAGQEASTVMVDSTLIQEVAADPGQGDQMFDQAELAELAELEADNPELQEQTAGFFGPRLGTIIILGVALVILL